MGTKIEWCDESWNPVVGCTKVSEGCQNCYAERMARRLAKIQHSSYYRHTIRDGNWNGEVFTLPSRLEAPLHWRKPRRIFVCSMSDLFHEAVPFDFISRVFDTIWKTNHAYLILTKRPQKVAQYLEWSKANERLRVADQDGNKRPNIWLGVTAENQNRADERIPILLQIPAAKRFVSIEPMLGPVDLQMPYDYFHPQKICDTCGKSILYGSAHDHYINGQFFRCGKVIDYGSPDWVIVGGESGPGARPLHPDWVRSVRDQCKAAGVPFFFKQWGRYYPVLGEGIVASSSKKVRYVRPGPVCMFPIGKKAAGCLLDGVEYKEWPADLRVQERPE